MKDKSRVTVDMTSDEHMCLKMACAMLGVTMKEFLIKSAFKRMEEIEDQWLTERARETLKNIDSGEEKTVSWKEAKKRLK